MAAKATKTEKKAYLGIVGLTAKKLNSIAEELNSTLGITPPIDVENLEDEDLLTAVKTTMEVDVFSNDELSDDVWALMKELGIEAQEPEEGSTEEDEKPAPKGKDKKPAGKAKAKAKDEPEDDGEDAAEEEPAEDEPAEDEKPAPKGKGKKEAPAKAAPKGKEEKPAKKDKPKAAAPKEARYTRMDAFASALLEGKKDKKAAETVFGRADELYVENTGKDSNLRESAWACKHALNALAACGYIEYDGTDITILTRP